MAGFGPFDKLRAGDPALQSPMWKSATTYFKAPPSE
jgi:hypothetical protein